MIFHILEGEEKRAVEEAEAGDIIMAPSMASYNKVITMLVDSKPGEMIYVRLDGWKYFPRVGDDKEVVIFKEVESGNP